MSKKGISLEILREPRNFESEKQKREMEQTCPFCGYSHWFNGGIMETEYGLFKARYYNLYTCKKCGAEWRYRKEDYK